MTAVPPKEPRSDPPFRARTALFGFTIVAGFVLPDRIAQHTGSVQLFAEPSGHQPTKESYVVQATHAGE